MLSNLSFSNWLDHQQTECSESTAFRFLNPDNYEGSVTFTELMTRAKVLSGLLLRDAELGDRALLMYPPGLAFIEAFLGCLYAGIVAVPAYPPKRNRNAERLLAIAEDCSPQLILTTQELEPQVRSAFASRFPDLAVLATDERLTRCDRGSNIHLPCITPEHTRFSPIHIWLDFNPKGVVITHANLLANEELIKNAFGHTKDSIVCGWLPPFHDMGLIGLVLQPLYVGIPSILMSPISFLADPIRWLRAISEYQATSSGGPNFAFDYCVDKIDDADCDGLDLSCWKVAFNGAEPVRAQTMDRFVKKFERFGFRPEAIFPCYGMAETTLFVAGRHGLKTQSLPCWDSFPVSNSSDVSQWSKLKPIVSCGKIATTLIFSSLTQKHTSAWKTIRLARFGCAAQVFRADTGNRQSPNSRFKINLPVLSIQHTEIGCAQVI